MGQHPSEIKQQIEQTRGKLGDTVEALGHKADVSTRAKQKASSIVGKVTGATPDANDVKHGARRAAGVAQENPLGLVIGATAVGFVAGMIIPATKVEERTIGPAADEVKTKALETGQEVLERGKDVAQQVAHSAVETAKDAGKEQAKDMGQDDDPQAGASH